MQQILNSQERNQAFLKFLIFFLITIILIIGAVYFNFRLPLQENKMLQNEAYVRGQQEITQQKFVTRMEEAIVLLDSLDKAPNPEQLKMQIDGKINDLHILEQNDNLLFGKMNKAIILKLGDLNQTKKALRSASGQASNIGSLEAQLKDCKKELQDANITIASLTNRPPSN